MVGWEYRLAGAPDPVATANLRWLSGYRHPRCGIPAQAAALRAAFAAPVPLMDGAKVAGAPVAVLPVLYHLLWQVRIGRCFRSAAWLADLRGDGRLFWFRDRGFGRWPGEPLR
jgi:hypothetical protein